MCPSGWPCWCILLTLCVAACDLEISEVTHSQGLSECTTDEMVSIGEENHLKVKTLKSEFKYCREDRTTYTLCLAVDIELDMEEEDNSGSDDEDNSEGTGDPKASVAVCYSTAPFTLQCKKVEFTVNHKAHTHQNQAKISTVITEPNGFPFGSQMSVYPCSQSHRMQTVVAPSLVEVCSQKLKKFIPQCQVPTVSGVINPKMNQVELQFEAGNKSRLSVCVQYEETGRCQPWNKTTIPLYSVTPCTCLQVWHEDGQMSRRSLNCPFRKTTLLQSNIWENVSVSVHYGVMNNNGTMLAWNLTAPCKLEGEVRLCQNEITCKEIITVRQQLANGTWRPNQQGLWETAGMFEYIALKLPQCVTVQVKGMKHELGPFCIDGPGRWRWSLLLVFLMLLVCLTALIFCLLRDFVKKWVWSWNHGGFVKVGRKGHVVLLSPPDVDVLVSQSVCQLGSLLCSQGFSVCVDQWSRTEQCNLGPLPWLHSQLLKISSMGGRVLLVLTHDALARIEEWSHCNKDLIMRMGEDRPQTQIRSPYSDMFTASLLLILGEKQMGRCGERFLLVKFDSHPTQTQSSGKSLPELVRGLPLFRLPSQTQSLLAELTVTETESGSGRKTWTGWRWGTSKAWRV